MVVYSILFWKKPPISFFHLIFCLSLPLQFLGCNSVTSVIHLLPLQRIIWPAQYLKLLSLLYNARFLSPCYTQYSPSISLSTLHSFIWNFVRRPVTELYVRRGRIHWLYSTPLSRESSRLVFMMLPVTKSAPYHSYSHSDFFFAGWIFSLCLSKICEFLLPVNYWTLSVLSIFTFRSTLTIILVTSVDNGMVTQTGQEWEARGEEYEIHWGWKQLEASADFEFIINQWHIRET